jgi:nucleoside 2-deoxyribosyltransferase
MRGVVASLLAASAPSPSSLLLPGAPKVYLAGPISGLNYDGATKWRDDAIAVLADAGIKGLSPMRAKEYLAGEEDLDKNCERYGALNVMSSPRGITTRDRFDATRCDVLFVNLLNADRVSIGTMFEIAWADAARIPVVCVMEPGNVHEHAMLSEMIGCRVSTVEEGLAIVTAFLA